MAHYLQDLFMFPGLTGLLIFKSALSFFLQMNFLLKINLESIFIAATCLGRGILPILGTRGDGHMSVPMGQKPLSEHWAGMGQGCRNVCPKGSTVS